jgi:hypothetical protein
MKRFKHFALWLCVIVWSGLAYGDNLQVSIANLVNGSVIPDCQDFTVKVNVSVENTGIKEVRIYGGTTQIARITKEPWEAVWKNLVNGYYYPFYVKAVDDDNNAAYSDTIGVFVGDVEPSNLIFNSNFNCSLFKWSVQYNSGATGSFTWEEDAEISEGGAAYLEITNGSDTDWHIQVFQIFPIDSGHTYEIYFIADTPTAKPVQWAMQENVGPNYTFHGGGPETLEGNNFYGPYEFVAPVTDPNNAFKFFFGANTIPVYLDDIWIIDRAVTFPEPVVAVEQKSGSQPEHFELFESYPNPFNSNTVIEYTVPVSANVELTIFNIRGEQIKTLVQQSMQPGQYQAQWDGTRQNGSPVSSGSYIAQLTTRTAAKTRIRTLKLTLME